MVVDVVGVGVDIRVSGGIGGGGGGGGGDGGGWCGVVVMAVVYVSMLVAVGLRLSCVGHFCDRKCFCCYYLLL